MFAGSGTAVNVVTVLVGSSIGVLAGNRLPDRTRDLVTDALSRRADTIRIEPRGPQAVVTILVDGMPFPAGKLATLRC